MSWEYWIERENEFLFDTHEMSELDYIFEKVVFDFDLSRKDRSEEMCDMRHFMVLWWYSKIKKKSRFKKYKTKSAVGSALGTDHACVWYYKTKRKKSDFFNYNTMDISSSLGNYF